MYISCTRSIVVGLLITGSVFPAPISRVRSAWTGAYHCSPRLTNQRKRISIVRRVHGVALYLRSRSPHGVLGNSIQRCVVLAYTPDSATRSPLVLDAPVYQHMSKHVSFPLLRVPSSTY
ncbi:hypothetical protein C8Q80DRAFT_124111 [Daedaleopsis nitida]|nr:hypothetical protein C8Q80DRAFT_124111 [Daedaleopsis nitida]